MASGDRRLTGHAYAVTVGVPEGTLIGDLAVPAAARAVVLFAYGSGTRRTHPHHRDLARAFTVAGFGTVLMDLRTREEERQQQFAHPRRVDVPVLAGRLVRVIDWLTEQDQFAGAELPVVGFGAGIGTAVALLAAAARVWGVIGRGGRADLAGEALSRVAAPVLLIDSGCDRVLQELNRRPADRIRGAVQRVMVPGATQLFEEPDAAAVVSACALEALERWCPPR